MIRSAILKRRFLALERAAERYQSAAVWRVDIAVEMQRRSDRARREYYRSFV
jgi:hypothetical protein